MARVLGKVDFGDGTPPRYFVHDDTGGWSHPALFDDPAVAWRIYDEGGSKALSTAFPVRSMRMHAIRKSLAWGRQFARHDEELYEPVYGIATADRLLWPLRQGLDEPGNLLLRADGILHVAQQDDALFGGLFVRPLCCPAGEEWTRDPGHQAVHFEQMFGQALDLCPLCAARLLA